MSWGESTPIRGKRDKIHVVPPTANLVPPLIGGFSQAFLLVDGRMKIGRRIGDLIMAAPGLAGSVRRIRTFLRRQRARHGISNSQYADWVHRFDTLSPIDIRRHHAEAAAFRLQPTISIVMPVFDPDPAILDAAIRSVRDQSYTRWELCIADDASSNPAIADVLGSHANAEPRIKLRFRDARDNISAASNTALEMANGDYVALFKHDDLLPPLALHWVVESLNRNPDAQILYSDEDKVDEQGRRFDPYFKSDFNHVLLLAQNMISRFGVYRRDLVESVGRFRGGFEGAQDYDLALRCVATVPRNAIVHIPRVLYHWRAIAGSTALSPTEKADAANAAQRAVTEHVRGFDSGATVEPAPESPIHLRVRHSLPSPAPLTSIVICTRDQEPLLRTAIESIRSKTTYPNYEIVVLDNGSRCPATLDYLSAISAESGITVVRDDSPFNYSRLNNTAVTRAGGAVLCLLNDDIEVLTPEWLEEMVSFAVLPDVGAVGAKLWYPDGTLQHGGVIIGPGGVAGHAHLRLAKGNAGYCSRAVLQQELSAVTGACLVLRRDVFEAVGGLDEQLAVAFNDVDLCLRIRAAGYRNIWTPFAELLHHESASRGYEDNPEKLARLEREKRFMQERWGATLDTDPYYNPNLSTLAGDYTLASRQASTTIRKAI
jgi:GT2 family glycosyltransferase